MIIESYVCGIPCKIEITRFFIQEPMGRSAPSADDCYGYTEIDFNVMDRRGRYADWLERKLTEEGTREIEQEIAKHMNGRQLT